MSELRTIEETYAKRYLGKPCTLDGEPAVIKRLGYSFAKVELKKRPKVYHVCTWTIVCRVMQFEGGKFEKRAAIFLKGLGQ